ncbi:hypothetical protein [Phenylobacterium sp.]|uniref:hypothetical protein n=1 Tax=Phenylobacterium sp. TaxID=1871053 RepID=UPI003561DB9F
MRKLAVLLAAALAVAGSAAAQTPSPALPPAKAKVLEGVTVTGKRPQTKPCKPRDAGCVAMVVAELKTRYPEKLGVWCMQQTNIAMDRAVHADWYGTSGLPPSTAGTSVAKVVQQACAPDKK